MPMNRKTMLLVRKIIARVIFGAITGYTRKRKKIAYNWLSGHGIEIGALHNPLPTLSIAKVTYIDIMSNKELRQNFPELSNKNLVHVDLIDNGESLSLIDNESQDFVIANHVLEHCANPIGALQAWLRILKNGGVAYIAVPDKRLTFDYKRPTTTWRHFSEDFNGDAENSKKTHYIDWLKNVTMISENEFEAALLNFLKDQPNIHFHTWTKKSIRNFFKRCQFDLMFPFSVCEFVRNGNELITIIKKISKSENKLVSS